MRFIFSDAISMAMILVLLTAGFMPEQFDNVIREVISPVLKAREAQLSDKHKKDFARQAVSFGKLRGSVSESKFLKKQEALTLSIRNLNKQDSLEMEQVLLAGLKKVPAKKTLQNLRGYQVLSLLDTDNKSYAKKATYYQTAIKRKKSSKKKVKQQHVKAKNTTNSKTLNSGTLIYTGMLESTSNKSYPLIITKKGDQILFEYPTLSCQGKLHKISSTKYKVSYLQKTTSRMKNCGKRLDLYNKGHGYKVQQYNISGSLVTEGFVDQYFEGRKKQTLWQGSYLCSQGRTSLTLTMVETKGGRRDAEFFFYPPSKDPYNKWGKFILTGVPQGSSLHLKPSVWINRPSGYGMVALNGKFNKSKTRYSGQVMFSGCSDFSVNLIR